MGKIRVGDLATKMGVPEQDLAFKLKSIGVRVEGKEAMIDTDVIQAILQGKQLPATPQREVIMRDKGEPAAPRRRRVRRPPPPGPMRPRPRRTVVHKADPKIKTLPGSRKKPQETPQPTPEEMAAREVAADEAARAAEAPSESPAKSPAGKTPAAAAGSGSARTTTAKPGTKRPGTSRPGSTRPSSTRPGTGRPPGRSGSGRPGTGRSVAPRNVANRNLANRNLTPKPAPKRPAPRQDDSRRGRRRQAQEEVAAAKKIAGEPISLSEGMRVRDLAEKLGLKTKDVMKHLIQHGVMGSVNHVVGPELAKEIAEGLGYEVVLVSFEEEVQRQHVAATEKSEKTTGSETRAPVVTVMGHVDHGKTSLLDAIRSSRLTEAESGGITQHIAAYEVELDEGKRVVFLDTPGHEAFTQLRARGAQVTDIVVLVVAADDGVMPQTVEAIQHARAAEVPILVALNKMDRDNANPDRLKQQLSEHELLVEDWGGDVVAVPMSALKKEGIDEMLEMINLTAEMLELKADPDLPAQGVVIEAQRETGRGTVATLLVQNGTLEVGQAFVAGASWGRVRSMTDDRGRRLEKAGPSTPVQVAGFAELPRAGDALQVLEKESQARDIAGLRQEEERQRELAPTASLSLESLFSKLEQGEVKELPVVIKADVQGSVEVLRETLLKTSTDKVKVRVIGAGVGAISTNDVLLASASQAIIYGFNVRPERNAADLAAKEEVDIRTHTVIYELTDELKKAMTGLLEPEWREVEQGRAEVRELFKVPKLGTVAGCHVVEGVIPRSASIRLLRDNVVVHEGRIGSLRRFKDDASEVRSGFDCGIGIERFQDVKPGDLIEAYTQEAVAPTL